MAHEQRERIVGTVGVVAVQQAQVAFELALAQGGIEVAGVFEGEIGVMDGEPGFAEGG